MRTLFFGSTGPGVQFLQLALRRSGYGDLVTDGIFGPLTRSAVIDFQRRKGLVTDGIVGRYTQNALMPFYLGYMKRRDGSIQPLDFNVVPTDVDCFSFLIQCCVKGLAARYPFLKVFSIGKSVMGKELWCMRFGHGENRILYNASHHANEWITTILLLKYTEELCRAFSAKGLIFSQRADEIFSYSTLAVIPAVDPDGIDLVTGELKSGDFFNYAKRISLDYTQYPFPSGWKANIRGVDLNLQYPAGWEQAKENKTLSGVTSPAPADFVGLSPLSAPESRAMYDFTLSFLPDLTLSYHTQGEVIYWKYLDYLPYNSRVIAEAFSSVSGYAVEETPYSSGFAGYKDWFISDFYRPGYTIEAGRGNNPLPISQFDSIYTANEGILTLGTIVT